MANFFAPHVFQAVLHDPATALRLKSFCEASACGENIAFLEKVRPHSYDKLVRDVNYMIRLINMATF